MARGKYDGWYRSKDVRAVCRVSQRELDYWSAKGYVSPWRRETPGRKRHFRLFAYHDLLRVRFIRTLRDAGFSLQQIHWTLKRLTPSQRITPWTYVVTDGKILFRRTANPGQLQSLMRRDRGQLAFAVLLIGKTEQAMVIRMRKLGVKPFDETRIRGRTRPPSEGLA